MHTKFIRRNLLIYKKDSTGIFFSFLGMFISLFIYVFFLRTNLIESLSGIAHIDRFIDTWMIAGLISIVSVTSPLTAFGQKLEDKKENKLSDFIVNGKLNKSTLGMLYTITSVIEGTISTVLFSIICFAYLAVQYEYNPFNVGFLYIILFSVLLVLFSSVLFSFITDFLNSTSSFSSLSAIVGTLAGFFSGTYIVYGELPKFMQRILEFWPGFQIASITRYEALKDIGVNVSNQIATNLGISPNINHAFLINFVAIIGFVVIEVFMNKNKQ